MERRVLLAIFLSFLVLYVWQALFVKPVPKPAAGAGGADDRAAGARRRHAADAAADAAPAPATRRADAVGRRARRARRRRHRRARRPRRDARRHRGVHQPRRAAEELAAEALPRSAEAAAGARRQRSRRRSRCRSRCGAGRRRVDRDAERALYAVSGAPADGADRRRRSICASNTATAPASTRSRNSTSSRRRTSSTFRATVTEGDQRAARRDRVGPGARRHRREISRVRQEGRGHPVPGRQGRRACAPKDIAKQPAYDGDFRLRRRRRPLLHGRGARARTPARSRFSRCTIPPPAGSKDAGARPDVVLDRAAQRRRAAQVLRRAEGLRRAQRDRSRSRHARSTSACSR